MTTETTTGIAPVAPGKAAAALARMRAGVKTEGRVTKAKPAKPAVKAKGKAATKRDPAAPRIVKIKGVKHDISHYKKAVTALGNTTLDSGDELAVKLRGQELDDVYREASKVLGVPQTELKAKYTRLNAGMQRMNLGNRMRAAAIRKAATKGE